MESMVDPAYWKHKQVLVTGHTGFKGSWLCHWLTEMGADVTGYALAPVGANSIFEGIGLSDRMRSVIGDINDIETLMRVMNETAPDVVFHLAAQSLVRTSYDIPLETLTTNVLGTANLLNAVRKQGKACDVVVVTSDKCYLNEEKEHHYQESDALGGFDPYSASKACAEIVIASFRQSYFADSDIRVASARAGNVIGGGDWAENRLIPDLMRAWQKGEPLVVRNPQAVRPWQHVLEPLHGYLMLAEKIRQHADFCQAWNFGPAEDEIVPVIDVLKVTQELWPEIRFECSGDAGPHEAALLMLDSTLAREKLGWQPRWNVRQAMENTIHWYQSWHEGRDSSPNSSPNSSRKMADLTSSQIQSYCDIS